MAKKKRAARRKKQAAASIGLSPAETRTRRHFLHHFVEIETRRFGEANGIDAGGNERPKVRTGQPAGKFNIDRVKAEEVTRAAGPAADED